eukprot:TRINITY_DN8768_c0_g1_i1.p1 TRINITY_DN8768_c0_g1~~TRINITY_DN8768_c0_g1_i1.p1  ORF type:complete len:601 (-),score=178.20 TRINITY_DN8768_c0_g1_i1:161-1963(-)
MASAVAAGAADDEIPAGQPPPAAGDSKQGAASPPKKRPPPAAEAETQTATAADGGTPSAAVVINALREELRKLRFKLAREAGMPAYGSQSMIKLSLENIFTDSALTAIATACPRDAAALAKVDAAGFGDQKRAKYGEWIVAVCQRFANNQAVALGAGEDNSEAAVKRRKIESQAGADSLSRSQLNEDQQRWADAALAGDSLFLTGEAGTGKSFLLSFIVQELRKTKIVAVAATTAMAGASIGGGTIHAFAGIGLGKGPHEKVMQQVWKSSDSVMRWRETDTLVIDEISMMDANLFTLLEYVARKVRGSEEPFGGLQILLCGDFLQLPPVESSGFAFESEAWKRSGMKTAELRMQMRQKDDDKFMKILSEVRVGICSDDCSRTLQGCSTAKKPPPNDGIKPTRLYCVNKDVDAENKARLGELEGSVEVLQALDIWRRPPLDKDKDRMLEAMEKQCPAALQVKVGAQIVVTKNLPAEGLVNGSRGVVVSVITGQNGRSLSVRCDNGKIVVLEAVKHTLEVAGGGTLVRMQVPVKLGWAMTVHRAQGCTLSRAELQLENTFDYGQAYVALSRVKSLAGLWIKGKPVSQREVRANPCVLWFYFG